MAQISYLDFDLQLERSADGYRARVISSPAGPGLTLFALPFSDLELENLVLKVGRPRRGLRRVDAPEVEAARALGGRLFSAVFSGEVLRAFQHSRELAAARGAGLRLRLRLDQTPELADLPWELLHYPALNRFLALSVETPLIRYLELPDVIRPLAVRPPLRVLVVISGPHDYPPLDAEREWQRLGEAVGELRARGLIELERLDDARLETLRRRLRQGEYHVFHFIGHGGFNRQLQDGLLLLEDEAGLGRQVSGHDLGLLLHNHPPLRLAVLNACEGARADRTDPFAGVAQSLVQQGIPAVIAMQFEISDQAAAAFATEFYRALLDAYPVDAALTEARNAVREQSGAVEWCTPVLYLRAPDGRIFDLAPTAPAPSPATDGAPGSAPPRPADTWETAASTLYGGGSARPEPAAPASQAPPPPARSGSRVMLGLAAIGAVVLLGLGAAIAGDDLLGRFRPADSTAGQATVGGVAKATAPSRVVAPAAATVPPTASPANTVPPSPAAPAQPAVSAPTGLLLEGHVGGLTSASFSSDGRLALTASADRTARLWDPKTGRQVRELNAHNGLVKNAVYSRDGTLIATASDDRTAKLWDPNSGRVLHDLTGHGGFVFRAEFSPDSRYLATVSNDMLGRLWDARTGARLAELRGHGDPPTAVAFSEDGKLLVTSGSNDSATLVWEVPGGRLVATIQGGRRAATALLSPPDGRLVAQGDGEGTLRVADARRGNTLLAFRAHPQSVTSVAFSPDGSQILTTSDDTTARLWQVRDGAKAAEFVGHTAGVKGGWFNLDGSLVLTVSNDNTARVWDRSGRPMAELRGHTRPVTHASFSLDSRQVITASDDRTARVFPLER